MAKVILEKKLRNMENDLSSIIDVQENNGCTALHSAVWVENTELVQLLVEHGANTDLHNEFGETALRFAVFKENTELVRWLVEHGADATITDYRGETPLNFAKGFPQSDKLDKIIDILQKYLNNLKTLPMIIN